MRQTTFYGWKLLAVLWFVLFANFAFPLSGSSVINAYMAAGLHFDRSTLGFAYAAFYWLHGIPAPLIAICVTKKGVRFTLTMGGALVAGGALIMATVVRSSAQVDVVFGVMIGLGVVAGGTLPSQAAVARWFVRKKARAISLLLTGSGIGGIVAPPLLNRVIAASGGNWRAGWLVVSGLSAAATLLTLWFVKERPSDVGQEPDGGVALANPGSAGAKVSQRFYQTTENWTFAEILRSPTMWLFLIASLGYSTGFPAFLAHGVVHLEDLGHSAAGAAFSLSVMALFSLIGHLVVAAIGDYINPQLIWSAGLFLFGAGIFLAVRATGTVGLYLYAVLLGMGYGSLVPSMMTVPVNYFGHKAYPSIVGLILAVGTTVGAIGAYLAGYGYDHFGSYAPAFYLIAGLCVGGSVLLMFMKPPVRRAAKSEAAAVTH
jgi:sugar phosphate permease